MISIDPRRTSIRLLSVPFIFLLTWACARPAAAQATFAATKDMTTIRDGPTATLLTDGRVLVTGGRVAASPGSAVLNQSAEIYDPKTGAFTATGAMNFPRWTAAAVRLTDGRVLVAGGRQNNSGVVDNKSAELFDPTKGTFTVTTGVMGGGREYTTGALLKDGRALIVGFDAGQVLAGNVLFSEIYDPKKDTFTPSGNLPAVREYQTSVAIPDGRVLIIGGQVIDNDLGIIAAKDVQVFDPASGSIAKIGQLNEGRAYPSATALPDGRVLVAGGIGIPLTAAFASSTVEIFDPASGQSTKVGNMSDSRFHHIAVALADGRVLLAGGQTGFAGNDTTASADIFDPKTGKLTPAAAMTQTRAQADAVRLLDGRVLIVGGFQESNGGVTARLQSAEIYSP